MARNIAPEVREILERSTIAGTLLTLPGQLDRKTYGQVNKVLTGLGGKWNKKMGGHVFPFEASELVESATEKGSYTSRQQDLQFFETPRDVAERMHAHIDWTRTHRLLEPSAGHGALLAGIPYSRDMTLVEFDNHNVTVLQDRFPLADIVHDDFLEWSNRHPGEKFDVALMNPPFTKNQDIAHVMAAWRHVHAGGVLVAVLGEGAFFRPGKTEAEFRDFVAERNGVVEQLPCGAFKESGTGAAARLIVLRKPGAAND